jgi:ABC-2 type transport system ATP-binding protein
MIDAAAVREISHTQFLRAENLTKRYHGDAAIADVSFSLVPGQVLGIIGPNGAGKTTLLETLAGVLAADSGTVVWHDQQLPPQRRKEALFYLPDGVKPYQDRFVSDVISFFAKVYGRCQVELSAAIDTAELAPVMNKRVSALSKGYNRRLLLAVGLLTPHDVLLMDEPFDGFDLRQTRRIVEVLRNEAAKGRTFVLAIHQLVDAERVCDRFILIAAGLVLGIGSLAALREQTGMPNGSLEELYLALT